MNEYNKGVIETYIDELVAANSDNLVGKKLRAHAACPFDKPVFYAWIGNFDRNLASTHDCVDLDVGTDVDNKELTEYAQSYYYGLVTVQP